MTSSVPLSWAEETISKARQRPWDAGPAVDGREGGHVWPTGEPLQEGGSFSPSPPSARGAPALGAQRPVWSQPPSQDPRSAVRSALHCVQDGTSCFLPGRLFPPSSPLCSRRCPPGAPPLRGPQPPSFPSERGARPVRGRSRVRAPRGSPASSLDSHFPAAGAASPSPRCHRCLGDMVAQSKYFWKNE